MNLKKSDFWLYPNINSHETFCISCLEAMCSGNVIITRDFSALPELIGNDNGLLIPSNLQGNDLINYVVKKIDYIISNNLKNIYQDKARKEAKKYDWKIIANKWKNMLN